MTITANATFAGTSPNDVDADAPMYKDVLKEIAQDQNLIYNIVTGYAGTSPTIDHSVGNGAPLGLTLVNQVICTQLAMSSTDAATYGGETFLWSAPVFFPENGEFYEACLFTDWQGRMELHLLDSSGTTEQIVSMNYDQTQKCQRTFFQVSATAAQRYLRVKFYPSDAAAYSLWLESFVVYRKPKALTLTTENIDTLVTAEVTLPQVTTAGVNIVNNGTYIHDEYFQTDYALHSVLLERMRNFGCKLWEYITGWPVDGNPTVTDSDSGDVNPSTSRFLAHTRSVYSGAPTVENLIDWPLVCEGLGAVRTDGTSTTGATATEGLGVDRPAWFPPFVVTASTDVTFHKVTAYCPDFPTASTLKGIILYAGSSGKATGKITLEGGSSVSDLTATSLGGSLYCLTFSGVDFDPDQINTWDFILNTNGAYAFNEHNILGVCLYFEP